MVSLEREYDARSKCVLVVDDEPLIRLFLAQELRESGLIVVEAGSADEALMYIRSAAQIDLVFTDIQMPGNIDGLGLAQSLKANNPYLPIIITSGMVTPVGFEEIGAFLPKPYDIIEAADLVFRSLGF